MKGETFSDDSARSEYPPTPFILLPWKEKKMPHTIDWQQAVHDPRFWALRYHGKFPKVTKEDYHSYLYDFYQLAAFEDDPLAGYVGEGDDTQQDEAEVGWRALSIPFPENYSWKIELVTGDAAGIYHSLFHPDLSPKGLLLAEESGHPQLPGLRWAELQHIETCLTRQGFSDFEVKAIIPLLYPTVWQITFDELQDVRQTLATVWQELQVLDSAQIEQWLDETIEVYDKGWVLHLNSQKEWKPYPYQKQPYHQRDLWIQTEENGWQATVETSVRHIGKDSHQWSPFFSMLERYAQDEHAN